MMLYRKVQEKYSVGAAVSAGAGVAAFVAIVLAPIPLSPNAGDQCWNWHATAQNANGQTMTCTHLPDSGHLMYWEIGGPRDS